MKPADIEQIIAEIDLHGMRSWLIQAFTASFREARKNKLSTFNEHIYDEHWTENIIHLTDAVLERYYMPSSSISFIIYEPMIREIFAAPFVDRVVHHFLYRMQSGWWDRRFIADSYSCRENKGTLYGILRTHKMMQQATNNFTTEAYVIKLDIRGYFMSLPRTKLLERVNWGLERQFQPYFKSSSAYQLFQTCGFLWRQILLDDPVQKSRRRGPISDWDVLPPEKSLYTQPPGRGIVIGNLTSQLVSNIYLDQLDRFIKYDLGYKYYGRYVDDFFIIVPKSDYERAKRDVPVIEEFLKEELGLTLHPKKRYYQSVYKGISFLGVRIYPHCLYPSNRIQKKFKYTLHKLGTDEIKKETVVSYFGYLKHLDVAKYVKQMFDKYGHDYNLYLESLSPNRRSWDEIMNDFKNHKNP
ncbi:RNA-directed DNA polymerase [Candidatus Saccharibacteria bacterium]|nr:RNA-directed DNA polymerase [Candidatus Saccharibacteria bacterium]